MYITLNYRYNITDHLNGFTFNSYIRKYGRKRTLHNFGLNPKSEIGHSITRKIIGHQNVCRFFFLILHLKK